MPPGVHFNHNPVQSVSRPLTSIEKRYFCGFEEHIEESSTCDQRLKMRAFADCCDYCHDYIIYVTSRLEHRKGQYIDRKSHDSPFTLVEIPPWYPTTCRLLSAVTEPARLRLLADYEKTHGITSNRSRDRLGDRSESIPRVDREIFSESSTRQCSNKGVDVECAHRSETSFSIRRLVILQGRIRSESSYRTVKTSQRWREMNAQQQTRLSSYPQMNAR
jgi:hypothetical protein